MVDPIPNSVKAVWARCNLEASIMLSLAVQGLLIFAAPFRMRSSRRWVIFLVWSTYLLADFVALFTLGLISNRQGDNLSNLGSKRSTTTSITNSGDVGYLINLGTKRGTSTTTTRSNTTNSGDVGYLYALWAPFCLLHLGGPDTITAFSLQDNSLWLRHLAGLIIQVVVAVYTFVQSLPENKLWLPITFILVAGLIKYAERTRALYLANFETFKANPGANYAKLMGEYSWIRVSRVPALIQMVPSQGRPSLAQEVPGDEVTAVQHAHHFFLRFMNLIVDQLVLFSSDLSESQQYFLKICSKKALKVLTVELNFFYEVLYTKALVVHRKSGYFFRLVSSAAIVVAFSLFLSAEKQSFHSTDVKVTYALFGGAIALDIVAFLMFVFSDWTVVALGGKLNENSSLLGRTFHKYLELKSSNLAEASDQLKIKNDPLVKTRKALFRRWSESVSSFTFLEYCLKELPNVKVNMMIRCWRTFYLQVIRVFGLKEIRDKRKYVFKARLSENLWEFVFGVLQSNTKVTSAEDRKMAKIMSSNIHDWISMYVVVSYSGTIRYYLAEIDYDRSLLLWHIATELVYRSTEETKDFYGETSKLLSDYMLYLIQMQPTLMSSVAGIAKKSFEDTCAEAHRFFSRIGAEGGSWKLKDACNRILEVHTDDYKPAYVKGGKSKSVLFDACILAKELKKMKKEKWKFLSRVWVGLLSYAACRCRPAPHLELLGKGGELITHVWLLMAHFGIGKQLYATDEHATAKLIVDI